MSRFRITGRILRVAIFALAFFAVTAALASADFLHDQLNQTRKQGRAVKQELSVVQQRQQRVVKTISALNQKLAAMQLPVDRLDTEITQLDNRISGREQRIEKLKQDYVRQAKDIDRLTAQHDGATKLLERRVVRVYKSGDTGMIEQLAGVGSLRDLFERQEILGQVLGLDQEVIDRITDSQRQLRLKRAGNHKLQRDIKGDIASLASDKTEVESKRAYLQTKVDAVAAVKGERDRALVALRSRGKALHAKLEGIEGDAKVLQEVIETGQSTYGGQVGNVSPAGLIWPVNGPIVSPFGQRWGRLHAGVDIAVPAGTPIHAAASGVVTYASWMSGYGNFVLIQHGGGLVTAYAHQSRIATRVGQAVSQGQLIGFIGCTGHCYGDHLHFETRMGTTPQDPMRYL